MARSYRRRKPKGGYTTVRGYVGRPKRKLSGGRRRKQRVRRLKKRGGQLRAGLKFNSRGQIVKDRNATRVANRRTKQANRRRKRSGRRPKAAATRGVRRRRRRR